MSELCLSSTPKTTQFSSLLVSVFQLLFSFILSHPLYFSYFIFLSPYLLKLLSFLSPLFITTSLLLLGFLTLSPGLLHDNSAPELPKSKLGFFHWCYNSIIDRLRPSNTDDRHEEIHHFEELEVFKIVFDTSTDFSTFGNSDGVSELETGELCFFDVEEKTVEIDWEETVQPIKEAKRLEGLLKELDDFENTFSIVEDEKFELLGTNFDKVEVQRGMALVETESEEKDGKIIGGIATIEIHPDNGGEYTSKSLEGKSLRKLDAKCTVNGGEYTAEFLESPSSRTLDSKRTDNGGECAKKFLESPSSWTLDSNLGSYGSMRREKEWKRTLACKLYEERHNVDGGEGMDSLWEAYEEDLGSKAKEKSNPKKKKNKNKKKGDYYEDDDDDDDEEEGGIDGQLCCLQALKFSAGKMNLGMGRPNLVKISKAIKGIGWLHHVTRHGKKGYK